MVFPRLFTCPTVSTRTFKVDFEVNLVILFSDGHLLTENFPLALKRGPRAASTTAATASDEPVPIPKPQPSDPLRGSSGIGGPDPAAKRVTTAAGGAPPPPRPPTAAPPPPTAPPESLPDPLSAAVDDPLS